jgi:hypothetical protein
MTFSFAGLLCPLFFIGFFVVVIATIIRALAKSAPGSGGAGRTSLNVPTQLEQDGFWMLSCPADPGSIIYYHYWSGGERYSGRAPFKPEADGRQFVYTGRRPEQVSVTRIVTVDDSLSTPVIAADSMWDPPDPPSVPSAPSPSEPPSSFPSAY